MPENIREAVTRNKRIMYGLLPVAIAGGMLIFFPFFRQNLIDTFTYGSIVPRVTPSPLPLPPAIREEVDNPSNNPIEITVGDTQLTVEIARSREMLAQGLSGRDSLPEGTGMLFVFSAPGQYEFWMKDMRFPIDIIWLRDNRVVGFTENAPVPDPRAAEEELPSFKPPEEITAALEVNAGFVGEHGIEVGDTIEYSSFEPQI